MSAPFVKACLPELLSNYGNVLEVSIAKHDCDFWHMFSKSKKCLAALVALGERA